jgi:hypothetical protein
VFIYSPSEEERVNKLKERLSETNFGKKSEE